MTHPTKQLLLLIVALFLFNSCKEDIIPTFSYSPTDPKAGEAIIFTNETTSGENWDWFFGDGSKSIYKSPSKTYSRPGVYNVTLRVDSNDHFVASKQIIVYDTIPTIVLSKEKVYYHEYFSLKPIVYNPFGEDVTYKWEFSDYAQGDSIKNNIANCEEVKLKYTRHSLHESVKLTVNIGDSTYTVSKNIWINDVKSHSLVMAAPNANLLTQRIYENGKEAHKTLEYTAPENVSSMSVANSTIYLSDNGNATTKPSIKAIATNDLTSTTVVSSEQVNDNCQFNNGYIQDGTIYWTDRYDMIYQTDLSTRNATFAWAGSTDAQTASPYYLAAVDRLPDFNNGLAYTQTAGGIAQYDNTYFYAKAGTGKGIYRFTQSEISATKRTTVSTSLGAILTDYAIETFTIDAMNTKIYFVSNTDKVYVSNIDGTQVTELANACTSNLVIDNKANRLYWASASKVQYMQLVTGSSNKPNDTHHVFADVANITLLALDTEIR